MYNAFFGALLVAAMDPFDCYNEDDLGESYKGLFDTTKSGRSCQKWSDTKPHESAHATLGNNNYCRNPDGKEGPWCYTLDTDTEWELCDVPKCLPASETPEQWVAPAGLKSDEAEAEGPCEPEPDDTPKYSQFEVREYGRVLDPGACKNQAGANSYLISGALHTADSEEACGQSCLETAGAKFMTFWETAFEDGGNCGCYRECLPTGAPEEGAVNFPSVFRINVAFLQVRRKRCKTVRKAAAPLDPAQQVKVRAAQALAGNAPLRGPAPKPVDTKAASKLGQQLGDLMKKLGWNTDVN
jgi:hypothetical protein